MSFSSGAGAGRAPALPWLAALTAPEAGELAALDADVRRAAVALLALGVMLQRLLSNERPTRVALPAQGDEPRLVPYLISGPSLVGYSRDLGMGQALKTVDIPRGGYLRASLVTDTAGASAVGRVTLIGPARVSVGSPGARVIDLHLEGGLLLARVVPGQGRTVRVTTGAVTTTVLGTVFAVEARRGGPVQVAVARGVVKVETSGRSAARVTAGQRWSEGSSRVEAVGKKMRGLLAEHQRGLEPSPPAEAGILLLSGTPMPATARLGSEVIARTPLAALLPVGAATVSIFVDDHHSATLTTQIVQGKVTRLGYSLEPRSPRPPRDASTDRPTQQDPRPGRTGGVTMSPTRPRHRSRHDARPRRQPGKPVPTPGPRKTTPAPDSGAHKLTVQPETAERLYQQAEQALRAGSRARAKRLLTRLVKRFASDPLASTARLEMARLAYDRGD
ncbi:MAG: FecR domain-containing protein, partial [Myxococcota bacterium]|nr:FecR domain-containing protein [Myxococcota bacterium]